MCALMKSVINCLVNVIPRPPLQYIFVTTILSLDKNTPESMYVYTMNLVIEPTQLHYMKTDISLFTFRSVLFSSGGCQEGSTSVR